MTALIFASSQGHLQVVHSLIQAGARVDRQCDMVRALHNLYHERYDREESRYKQVD